MNNYIDLKDSNEIKSNIKINNNIKNINNHIPNFNFIKNDQKINDPTTTQPFLFTNTNQRNSYFSPSYKDTSFGIAFCIHFVFIFFLALNYGVSNISTFYITIHDENDNHTKTNISQGMNLFLCFLITSIIAGIISSLWLFIIQNFAMVIMKIILQMGSFLFIISAILTVTTEYLNFFSSGIYIQCIFFLLLAFLNYIYYKNVSSRIPFVVANITLSNKILLKYPWILYEAIFALFIQILWIIQWGAAVIGIWSELTGNLHGYANFTTHLVIFFMLISLFWGLEVIKNVIHCVVAGTTGDWWFKNSFSNRNSVQQATKRALTTSFGSICFGSLVTSFLIALQKLLTLYKHGRKINLSKNGSINACLDCLLKCIDRSVKYFNKYAYVQVALYGKDYCTAGYDTFHLFKERGWSMVINDSLIHNILSVGCFLTGACTGFIGSIWTYTTLRCTDAEKLQHPDQCEIFDGVLLIFTIGFIIGYAMCSLVSSIIISIVSTIFVCFAEDPVALQKTNPAEFTRIVQTWEEHYPELLVISKFSHDNKKYVDHMNV